MAEIKERPVIYLDNAASTWPKPPRVKAAMVKCIDEYAANPGRGSHYLAAKAASAVADTRRKIAQLFAISNPRDVIFFANATGALNQAIFGMLNAGDHVITTAMEHNSVRRPLEFLKRDKAITVSYIYPSLFIIQIH